MRTNRHSGRAVLCIARSGIQKNQSYQKTLDPSARELSRGMTN